MVRIAAVYQNSGSLNVDHDFGSGTHLGHGNHFAEHDSGVGAYLNFRSDKHDSRHAHSQNAIGCAEYFRVLGWPHGEERIDNF
jgi:hypothetical protein